jgi:two-component system, NtrC family, sensor histidine kinase KinB
MLRLKHKLLLGFGGLLLIILVVGGQGISRLTRLGGSIDVILRENYRSVIACERMKESVERIDSGALFVLLGEKEGGSSLIDTNLPRFAEALQTELDNITLPGEKERAWRIRDLFSRYQGLVKSLLSSGDAPFPARRDIYFGQLLPTFSAIKNSADEILQMNQKSMTDADERAKRLAASARWQMYVLLFAGIIIGLGFMLLAGRWILRPISLLTRSAEEIRRGNLDLVVPVASKDEVGALSEAFNQMAGAVREFRRSDRAKVYRYQKATQAAFSSLPEAVAVIDLDGQVEVATGPAKEIFGLKANAPVSMLPDPWIDELYQEVIKKGRQVDADSERGIVQRFVKGAERYFRPRGIPIFGERGEPTGVVLLIQDITLLRQQDEMKRGVISTVSHQLKTPLTSLQMAIHLLLSEKVGILSPKQGELLVVAREEGERLQTIIDDLLDLSRMESGKVKMNFAPVSPASLALEGVEPFRRPAQERGLLLTTEIQPGLPDVRADAMQIGHVFSNLLSNALKYTPSGGSITVSVADADGRISFSVADTGRGIPPEYRGKIFEKFVEIPGEDAERGAGLGLSIVKEIITAHGGEITVEGAEGKGTAFTFSLPKETKRRSHSGQKTAGSASLDR